MTRRVRERLSHLGLLLGGVLVGMLALEVMARVAAAIDPGVQGGLYLYAEHDPLLGWKKRPGAHASAPMGDYTLDMHVNSHGLRGPDRPYQPIPGTVRFLVLGDSFVEAFPVGYDDSLPAVMERQLSRGNCPIEVINGGTGGYSTDQELLFYRTEGIRYQPQVVILVVYCNDVAGNISDKGKPVFRLKDGALVLEGVPLPAPVSSPRKVRPTPTRPFGSAALAWLHNRLERRAPRWRDALADVGLWAAAPPRRTRSDFRVYKRRSLDDIETAWTVTAAILSQLAREVDRAGSRLLVVYAPNRFEIDDHIWRLTCERFGWTEATADRRRVRDRLQSIARDLELPLVDLTESLRKADGSLFGGGVYYPNDIHWSPRGNRVAAGEITEWLRAHRWAPRCNGRP